MRKVIGRTLAAAAVVALAGTGFAGTALAGNGGTATNNCLNVGIPILSGLNVIAGQGTAIAAACTANANGS